MSTEGISQAVWRLCHFRLSGREGEERPWTRRIRVTEEAIRPWCCKLGQPYAHQQGPLRPWPGTKVKVNVMPAFCP